MKNSYLVIGIGLLVAFLSISAVAQNGGGRRMRLGPMPDRMQRGGPGYRNFSEAAMILRSKEKLQLFTEQVTKLEAIVAKVETGNKAVQDKRDALRKAVQAKAAEAALRSAAAEVGSKMGVQAVLQVSTEAEIDTILTADQKAAFQEMRTQRRRGRNRDGSGDGQNRDGRAGYERRERNPEADFARIDSDGNDVISFEEFKAYAEQRQRRGGRGQRDGQGR